MSFSVGIVGLPNVGKSTLFKALTKKQVDIAAYPFTTISPNVGIVTVPDERLEKIAQLIKPEKVTPTIIEFVDIAGLVKGAHKGEGLGNQFLAKIRECEAILEVVRAFSAYAEGYGGPAEAPPQRSEGGEAEKLTYQLWEPPNPERDVEIVKIELIMKDLETVEKYLQKLDSESKTGGKEKLKSLEILKKFREVLSKGKLISEINLTEEEIFQIKDLQLLTQKPIIYVFNVSEKQMAENPQKFEKLLSFSDSLLLDLKTEEEISELSQEEVKEMSLRSQIDQLILICYNILDLITFYTITGGKETRAWTLKRGSKAPEAGEKVHSDFKEFIKAEIIPWQKLVTAGSWQTAREKGWIRSEGKDYIVQDGDVIEFKI